MSSRCCSGVVDLEALALVIILMEGVNVGVLRTIVIAFCARVVDWSSSTLALPWASSIARLSAGVLER